MAWYNWILIYVLIIAVVAFWTIPGKSFLSGIICIGIAVGAYYAMKWLDKRDTKKEQEKDGTA